MHVNSNLIPNGYDSLLLLGLLYYFIEISFIKVFKGNMIHDNFEFKFRALNLGHFIKLGNSQVLFPEN